MCGVASRYLIGKELKLTDRIAAVRMFWEVDCYRTFRHYDDNFTFQQDGALACRSRQICRIPTCWS